MKTKICLLFLAIVTTSFCQIASAQISTNDPGGYEPFIILVPVEVPVPAIQCTDYNDGWVRTTYPARGYYNYYGGYGYRVVRGHSPYREGYGTSVRVGGPRYVRLPNGAVQLAPNRSFYGNPKYRERHNGAFELAPARRLAW